MDLVIPIRGAIRSITKICDELENVGTQASRLARRIRALEVPLSDTQRHGRSYSEEALDQLAGVIEESSRSLEMLLRSTFWWRVQNRHFYTRILSNLSSSLAAVLLALKLSVAREGCWEEEDELDRAQDQDAMLERLGRMREAQRDKCDEIMQATLVRTGTQRSD